MNSTTLRRLVADHASLHSGGLPPFWLFPPTNEAAGLSEDLTQLLILLTGPQGTPYSQGLWSLFLRIPEDYPKNPPKAFFRTRIWHPNVDESSGSVCVDTLKRDWDSSLTLRDVLVTLSCLLIQPNPDSALNSTAGHLLREDFAAFTKQAKLMTSIHASIPSKLAEEVITASTRGDQQHPEDRSIFDIPAVEQSIYREGQASQTFSDAKSPLASQNRIVEKSHRERHESGTRTSKENEGALSPLASPGQSRKRPAHAPSHKASAMSVCSSQHDSTPKTPKAEDVATMSTSLSTLTTQAWIDSVGGQQSKRHCSDQRESPEGPLTQGRHTTARLATSTKPRKGLRRL